MMTTHRIQCPWTQYFTFALSGVVCASQLRVRQVRGSSRGAATLTHWCSCFWPGVFGKGAPRNHMDCFEKWDNLQLQDTCCNHLQVLNRFASTIYIV